MKLRVMSQSLLATTLALTLFFSGCSGKNTTTPTANNNNSGTTADVTQNHDALISLEAEPADMFTYEFGRAFEGGRLIDGGDGTWVDTYRQKVENYSEGIILTKYRGNKTQVKIPDEIDGYPVVGIDSRCFLVGAVTDVYFPKTLKYFEWGGSINSALSGELKIPYGVTKICTHNGNTTPDPLVDQVTKVIIPDTVTTMGLGAFERFASLTNITIPSSVKEIESDAFWLCESLLKIEIQNDLVKIGSGAFEGTSWLDAQPSGMVYAGKVAYTYKGDMPPNTHIIIKDGTLGIADEAFAYKTSLSEITIPNSVTEIGYRTFRGCTSLTNATLPKSITQIGYYTFAECTSLRSINIPSSVTKILATAFYGCGSLSEEPKARILSINSKAFEQ